MTIIRSLVLVSRLLVPETRETRTKVERGSDPKTYRYDVIFVLSLVSSPYTSFPFFFEMKTSQ